MSGLPNSPFVYAITDRSLAGEPDISVIVRQLSQGKAGLIQIREKNISTSEFTALAASAVETAAEYNIPILINDRVDVALYSGARGVHLGDDEMPPKEARKLLGTEAIIGVSCHSISDVKKALEEPLDYIAVGPIYPTETKQLKYEVVGLELIRQARAISHLPLVAIGGITGENAKGIISAGADSVSVISMLMVSGEIEKRTANLHSLLCSC
jgi:thiamine-phosphate pyrophosphorylase